VITKRDRSRILPVRELQSGLWWWEAVHPDWTAEDASSQDWGPEVSSYAFDDGERLLLIDPTTPPSPIAALAAERETVVVLTCPWHERDTRSLVAQVGASVFSPPPDSPGDDPLDAHTFTAGTRLPVGVEAYPGMEPNDLVLWIEGCRALIAGDTLIDRGKGFEFRPTGRTRASRRRSSSRRCVPCSSCRSRSCCRRTAHRPAERTSSGHSPSAAQRTSCATRTQRRS
jgi:glyoxylase-like metal-dependent hydrolase (beta-lactamase superfamily II)